MKWTRILDQLIIIFGFRAVPSQQSEREMMQKTRRKIGAALKAKIALEGKRVQGHVYRDGRPFSLRCPECHGFQGCIAQGERREEVDESRSYPRPYTSSRRTMSSSPR